MIVTFVKEIGFCPIKVYYNIILSQTSIDFYSYKKIQLWAMW